MISDEIFELCRSKSEGQLFDPLEYDQLIKKPKILNHIFEDKEFINKLYKLLKKSYFSQIERTKNGAIKKHNVKHWSGAYDVRQCYTKKNVFKGVIITVIIFNYVFVFKCGHFAVDNSEMNGRKAMRNLVSECNKQHIDIKKYEVENGEEIKQTIPKPYITLNHEYAGQEIEHVHHLDINSAWPAGCCKDYPELTDVFKKLREIDKYIGDMALGYCQSEWCDYKYANLAKSGIVNTNRYIINLMTNLINQKFDIACINTDGIWYFDKTKQNRIYHDENEGTQLGQWKTDHKDCTFYGYSDGQYYFIEDGKFNVRARGYYWYEQIKPREQWDKEDFFKALQTLTVITWDENEGFIIQQGEI